MTKVRRNKWSCTLLLGFVASLSQYALATKVDTVLNGTTLPAAYASSSTPLSVVKISSADDITIEATIETKGAVLPLAIAQQNSISSLKSNDSAAAVAKAEQRGLFRIYRSNLLKKTYQHVIYPESAIDRNQTGDVILKITITRDGKIKTVDYHKRAEYNSLNKAATKAVYNAKPFPVAPSQLKGETFEVIMPIKFRLAG